MAQSFHHDFIVTPVGADLVIYDQARHITHHLNPTAARVWQETASTGDAALIASRQQLPIDTVHEALRQLAQADLVTGPVKTPVHSRRRLLARVAVAGIAAPVVISLTAPMASAQESGCVSPSGANISISFVNAGSSWSAFATVSGFCPDIIYLGRQSTRQTGGPESGGFLNFQSNSSGGWSGVVASVPKGGGYQVKYDAGNFSSDWVNAPS